MDRPRKLTLNDVRADWRCLDSDTFSPPDVELLSNDRFTVADPKIGVRHIPPHPIVNSLRFLPPVYNLLYALQLLWSTKRHSVLIISGSSLSWLAVGLLNHTFFFRKRRVVLWDAFVEVTSAWKRRMMILGMSSMHIVVLWSRKQIAPHARWLALPQDRFIFLPYKANHSKRPVTHLSIDGYVFAGGNGKRDYNTLVEAVKGTGIPVIISATERGVRERIPPEANVIRLAAWEPAFSQLQAGARIIVVPMVDTGLKGGGEANFCNAMWHGKPIIAVDRMSADEYILEGETGFVVPPGDSKLLRERILALWRDPERCRRMGENGRRHALKYFTHELFIRRLLRLASLCGNERGKQSS